MFESLPRIQIGGFLQRQVKRILFIGVTVALICSLLVLPVYADVDYNDYITNIVVDGSNDLVTSTIPADDVYWSVFRSGVNYYSGDGSAFVTREPLPSMDLADIYSNWFYIDPLILSNIPNATSISGCFNLKLHFSPASNADSDFERTIVIHYLSSSGAHISYDVIETERITVPTSGVLGYQFDFPFSYVLDKPDGAAFAYFETRFYFYSGHSGSVTISGSVSDLTLKMSISSLYRLQQQTGKTNQLLEQVEDLLADQGKTLDDILGSLNQDSGGASGQLKDDVAQQGDKLDQMAGVMDSVDRPDPGDINISMDQYISQDDFHVFSPFMQLLWDTPIFMKMLMMLLMVAAVSYVLFGKKG